MYKVYGDYLMHCSDDTLAHHGILGMKWGVRRYQNEDGTLTDAGRKRYAKMYSRPEYGWKEKANRQLAKTPEYAGLIKAYKNAEHDFYVAEAKHFMQLDRFYLSKEYRKIANMFAREIAQSNNMPKWQALEYYLYYDWDQGKYDSFQYYINSSMPGSEQAKRLNDDYNKKYLAYRNAADNISDKMTRNSNGDITIAPFGTHMAKAHRYVRDWN